MSDQSLFQQKLAERRAKESQKEAELSFDPDLVPDAASGKSEQDQEMDALISRIGIIEAYQRWCGKSQVNIRGNQTESIMVSCPKPDHPDKDPSAWLNTDKNTWFCGGCQEGGDQYDIAAYNFGFPVPQYKSGATFHELRRKMAESLGYSFITAPGLAHPVLVAPDSTAPVPSDPVTDEANQDSSEDSEVASVTSITESWDDEEIVFPTLDWERLVEPNTFLDAYMKATRIDDVPEEYHFWNAMLAIGFAVGRDVTLYDRVPVFGNLFICLLGNTGDGKSRSFSHLRKLLNSALPHKWDNPASKGVHVVGTPASAEVLIHNFSKPMLDPTNPKVIVGYAPVRGLIEFNELSALASRANRQGNALKPALMEFYDMPPSISTSSMATGKKQADFPFGSVFTTTQPKALKELTRKQDADSGFLNRWIFASGKPKKRVAIGGVQIDILTAVKPLQDIQGWAGFNKTITWEVEAAALFTKFFHEQLHPKQQSDDSGLLTRMDLTFKKLILLFTVNSKLDSVPVEMVEKVISMYNYLVGSYAIPAAQVGNSVQIEIQEDILRIIKNFKEKFGKGPTIRDLGLRIKSKKYQPEQVHKMLKILCEMGEIQAVATSHGKAGRPSVRYENVG